MNKPHHLNHAPIEEAIVDIRVKARADFDPSIFLGLQSTLADRYPDMRKHHLQQASFQLKAQSQPTLESKDLGLNGVFFRTSDGRQIAQFRVDGFTFNKLKPYSGWEEVQPEAMALWRRYDQVALPPEVTRIALRYINRFEMPEGVRDFDDILAAGPRIPRALPQTIGGFSIRTTIVDETTNLHATVSQMLEPTPPMEPLGIILDIDVFHQIDRADTDGKNDSYLHAKLELLHEFKNRIFFNYLTDRMIGRFK